MTLGGTDDHRRCRVRRTHKESLKFEQALAYEMKHLMRKLDIEELTAAEMAEIELKASDRAEAAFDNWVNQGIDERKERKAFGGDK